MSAHLATMLIHACEAYLAVGVVVAAAFLIVGIDRIDPSARGSYAFRPLVAPGIALLWPLVLARWIALERGRTARPET